MVGRHGARGAFAATVGAACLLAGPALAQKQPLVDGSDPAIVVELMRGYGSARLDKGDDGMPMIRGRIDGDGFSAFFYDCDEDGTNCESIGLSAFFEKRDVPLEDVNAWNAANRFGRAYLRGDGKPVLEMDINLEGGVTADNFELTLDQWAAILKDFGSQVVNRDKPDTAAPKPPAAEATAP